MTPLRFGLIGCGFWSRFQLAAWRELPEVECVALCDHDPAKAERLGMEFGISQTYEDAAKMLAAEKPDFVDVVSDPGSHRELVDLAAAHAVPVICQKPMALRLGDAQAMVLASERAGVPFLVHENWRWQRPIRALAECLGSGAIGSPFRARIDFCCSFPVFENQPTLAELEKFIIADVGVHLLDVARFLFGDAQRVFATTARISQRIKGEDVATVVTEHGSCTVVTNMSYASRTAHERFPETFVFVEGSEGSAEIGPDYRLRVTTKSGTHEVRAAPPSYSWADPAYLLVQSSMVDCQRNLVADLRGESSAETNGNDNLKTLRLVFGAYESASTGNVILP